SCSRGLPPSSSLISLPPGSTSDPLRHVSPSVQVSAGTESSRISAVISDSKPSSDQTGGRATQRPGTARAPLSLHHPSIHPLREKRGVTVPPCPPSSQHFTRSFDALQLRGAHYFIRRASLSGEIKSRSATGKTAASFLRIYQGTFQEETL
ncbi:hypothetical protein FQA47_003886, partial [Oryzias melastigma]